MDDDLIPPTNPQEHRGDKPPKDDPRKKRDDNAIKKITPANADKRTKAKAKVFDGIFTSLELLALVLWMLAESFYSHGYWFPYAIFLSLAGSCFILGIAHIANKLLKRPVLWSLAGFLSLLFTCVVFALSVPPKTQKPHVCLMLNTADAPRMEMRLTNDFLNVFKGTIAWAYVRGCVVIPVASAQTEVTLKLSVVNNSSALAETVSTVVRISETNLTVIPNVGPPNFEWQKMYRSGKLPVGEADFQAFHFLTPVLHPHMGQDFPGLTFQNIRDWMGKPVRMWATFDIKGVEERSGIAFWLLFTVSTNSTEPTLVTTNWFPLPTPN